MQVRAAEVRVGDVIQALRDEWKVRAYSYDDGKLGQAPRMVAWLVSTDERWTTSLAFELSAMVDVSSRCAHRTTVDDCCNGWCERCLDCGALHL